MSLATYLYNSEGDVLLNDVRFHSVVLLQVPYFQAQRRFHEENKSENIGNGFLLDDFSPEATRVLKQILYEQPIAFDFKNVSLYGEIFELIRRLELKVDMGALVKQLDEVISDDARFFLFEKGFDHFDLPNKLTSKQVEVIKGSMDLFDRWLQRWSKYYLDYNMEESYALICHKIVRFVKDPSNSEISSLTTMETSQGYDRISLSLLVKAFHNYPNIDLLDRHLKDATHEGREFDRVEMR